VSIAIFPILEYKNELFNLVSEKMLNVLNTIVKRLAIIIPLIKPKTVPVILSAVFVILLIFEILDEMNINKK